MGVQHTRRALTHWFCKGFAETGGPRNTAKNHTTQQTACKRFLLQKAASERGREERGREERRKGGAGREEGGR